RGPYVELRAVLDRLANAERDRNQIGQEREPDAERDRDRQLLLDELENGGVAKIALAEIEARIIPQHDEEALVGRLVEAELLLQALDEFGIEALRAAIFGGHRVDCDGAAGLAAGAELPAWGAGDARGHAASTSALGEVRSRRHRAANAARCLVPRRRGEGRERVRRLRVFRIIRMRSSAIS